VSVTFQDGRQNQDQDRRPANDPGKTPF
jgi:hypothetical protein